MKATFLGTSDGFTSPRRDHSGILLQAGDLSLLADCGAVVPRYLVTKKLPVEVPALLWISHMHSDHNGQLSSLIQSLWLRQRKTPLHILGPASVLADLQMWLAKCLLFPALLGFPIHWHPLQPGGAVTLETFTLTAFATEHLARLKESFGKDFPATSFDCFGFVLEYGGRRYVYSSDLAHPRELATALKGGPVTELFCEITHFPERELFHELASYEVGAVRLTHYPERLAGRGAYLRKLAREEKFKGAVYLMRDQSSCEI